MSVAFLIALAVFAVVLAILLGVNRYEPIGWKLVLLVSIGGFSFLVVQPVATALIEHRQPA